MLLEMYISNFVLIKEQRMDFAAGLNVLTGETGAGKSIIIDALGLLLGERIKNDYIRDANKKAVVEAVFDLHANQEARTLLLEQDLLEADDSNIIISRGILPNGRNTARINGRNVNVNTLKVLGITLVDMQLQNDRYDFLNSSRYLTYVDGFAEQTTDLLERVAELYSRSQKLQKQLQDLESGQQLRTQKLDFLDFQIKEIEDSKLQEGEEEELKELRERIRNARSFLDGSNKMMELLYSCEQAASAYDMISSALDIAMDHKEDRFFTDLLEPLENMSYTLQDLSRQLSSFSDTLEFEPGLLETVEDRLYLIAKIKKKYGASIPEILEFLASARSEYEVLEHSDERLEEMHKELLSIQEEYMRLATELTGQRQKAALFLEERVRQQLAGLNMPHIRFQIDIRKKNQPGPKGMDEIEFLFSPNPGEEMRAISKIASGGEVSRFILALKIALAEVYRVPTLIFDEIDTGIGGTALSSMAQKIAELAVDHQVILVTHSPQLASFARQHLFIDKYVEGDRTYTSIKPLAEEERIKELARMLDGENYSELTLQHAREMLESRKK